MMLRPSGSSHNMPVRSCAPPDMLGTSSGTKGASSRRVPEIRWERIEEVHHRRRRWTVLPESWPVRFEENTRSAPVRSTRTAMGGGQGRRLEGSWRSSRRAAGRSEVCMLIDDLLHSLRIDQGRVTPVGRRRGGRRGWTRRGSMPPAAPAPVENLAPKTRCLTSPYTPVFGSSPPTERYRP